MKGVGTWSLTILVFIIVFFLQDELHISQVMCYIICIYTIIS